MAVKTWTWRGVVEFYVLFFIHVQTRRVIVTGITEHANAKWMAQQAHNLAIVWGDEAVKPRFLIDDHDSKYTAQFKALLAADDVECVRTSIRRPNQNCSAERWVQTLRTECLDHFLSCGERHLRYLVSRFVKLYNTLRPHQGRDNRMLPEVIEADHETSDDEPVILKFPPAERERRKMAQISRWLAQPHKRVAV